MSAVNRGRAGKYGKPKRGGGKHFSRDLRPIDADGIEQSMWAEPKASDSSDDSSDSDSDSSSDDGLSAPKAAPAELTREERRAAAKARKEAAIAKQNQKNISAGDLPSSDEDSSDDDDADMPANPNHTAKARSMAAKPVVAADPEAAAEAPKRKVIKKDTDLSKLSRREREALQAQQAKERYAKLHAAGKTDEARADMERLKLVRQQREEQSARKEAERQEKEEQDKSKSDQIAREERMRALAAGKASRGGKRGGKK